MEITVSNEYIETLTEQRLYDLMCELIPALQEDRSAQLDLITRGNGEFELTPVYNEALNLVLLYLHECGIEPVDDGIREDIFQFRHYAMVAIELLRMYSINTFITRLAECSEADFKDIQSKSLLSDDVNSTMYLSVLITLGGLVAGTNPAATLLISLARRLFYVNERYLSFLQTCCAKAETIRQERNQIGDEVMEISTYIAEQSLAYERYRWLMEHVVAVHGFKTLNTVKIITEYCWVSSHKNIEAKKMAYVADGYHTTKGYHPWFISQLTEVSEEQLALAAVYIRAHLPPQVAFLKAENLVNHCNWPKSCQEYFLRLIHELSEPPMPVPNFEHVGVIIYPNTDPLTAQ